MNRKNLLSLFCVGAFVLLALASTVNKIHYGAFNYNNRVEDPKEKENYLVKEDGTRVYGKDIRWKSGILTKDQIQIDDQKFKMSEVVGYRKGDSYYGRLGAEYIKRIVHGKINVYVSFYQVTSTNTDHSGFTHTSTSMRAAHYAQKGETGPLHVFAGQEDIKALVKDCPLAFQMADLSNSKMR